jgi:hypothetical protein
MEVCYPFVVVRSSRVRLLSNQRLRLEPTAGELQSVARSRSKQFCFQFNNLYYAAWRRHDYPVRDNWDYYNRHNGYGNYNSHSVIVGSRGQQLRQPAAGELHSDARGLHRSNNDSHNDYRDHWHDH